MKRDIDFDRLRLLIGADLAMKVRINRWGLPEVVWIKRRTRR